MNPSIFSVIGDVVAANPESIQEVYVPEVVGYTSFMLGFVAGVYVPD